MSEPRLTHLDDHGLPRMVDVGDKPATRRVAVAEGTICTQPETIALVEANGFSKGNVLAVAQLAGIMGAKRTADLIPLCHPLALSAVELRLHVEHHLPGIRATCTVRTEGRTGAEMEALTAVTCALLTVYDMCKAVDRAMSIGGVRLLRKSGGRTGDWTAGE